jgi:hypothetical protein
VQPASRMRPSRVLVLSVVACLAGCGRTRATPASKPAPASIEAPIEAPGETAEAPATQHGSRKLMNLDAPVFVDGAEVAVLRFGDLPPVAHEELAGGTPSFRLADYLEAIGVPVASVRAVHLHGNSDRIASVEGTELRAQRGRFTFTFSSGTTGTPVQRWDTEGLANGFVVHEIRTVSVFVKKAPVAVHPRSRCHLTPEGACTKDVPYQAAEPMKGTRVVVDGRMIGAVKRRRIGDDLILGPRDATEDEITYSVAGLARSFGMREGPVTAVELVSGDDVIARASGEQWARLARSLAFTLPRHQHGKVRVRVPVELQAEPAAPDARDADALVSAILVYRATRPLPRPLARISDETDLAVRLASSGEP